MLQDQCPDYHFVNELEAHKIFVSSGLDSKEQFKIWKRAGKKWDATAIRDAIRQYSDDLEALDADRVARGKRAEGARKGKWKKRVNVSHSATQEGTDLRPIDVQQGKFAELLDNTVPFDPLNPCFLVRASLEDDENLSDTELARIAEDPSYQVIDPDDEHGVYYTSPCADSDEDCPEPLDSSDEEDNDDVEDDDFAESGEEIDGSQITGVQDESGFLHIEDVDVDGQSCYLTYYEADNGDLIRCEGSTDDTYDDNDHGTSEAEDKLARQFYEEELKAVRVAAEGSAADSELIRQEAQASFGDFKCYYNARAKAKNALRLRGKGHGRGKGSGKGGKTRPVNFRGRTFTRTMDGLRRSTSKPALKKRKGSNRSRSRARGYKKNSNAVPKRPPVPVLKEHKDALCTDCDNRTATGFPVAPHKPGSLICPKVQSGKVAPHPPWNEYRDRYPPLKWPGSSRSRSATSAPQRGRSPVKQQQTHASQPKRSTSKPRAPSKPSGVHVVGSVDVGTGDPPEFEPTAEMAETTESVAGSIVSEVWELAPHVP